jgi:myosin V
MSIKELYTADTRVWIPDVDKVWKAARLLENYEEGSNHLRLFIENDEDEIIYDIGSKKNSNLNLPPLRNPDILIGQNDLTALSYLNEAEGSLTFFLNFFPIIKTILILF